MSRASFLVCRSQAIRAGKARSAHSSCTRKNQPPISSCYSHGFKVWQLNGRLTSDLCIFDMGKLQQLSLFRILLSTHFLQWQFPVGKELTVLNPLHIGYSICISYLILLTLMNTLEPWLPSLAILSSQVRSWLWNIFLHCFHAHTHICILACRGLSSSDKTQF